MTDSVTQPENDITTSTHLYDESTALQSVNSDLVSQEQAAKTSTLPVLWTPRFILLFFLTAVVGLSLESVLTQAWLNKLFNANWFLLVHTLLLLTGFVVLSRKARSTWMRLGAIIGCVWAVFTCATYIALALGISPTSLLALQFRATTASALFAAFICLSTSTIPFRRWDALFFWLAPVIGVCAMLIVVLLTHNDVHVAKDISNAAGTILLLLCFSTWWLRPSCWRSEPCPTFLFGLTSLLLLYVPTLANDSIGTPVFFSQVTLLCMLLAVIRVVQGEVAGKQLSK